MADFIIKKDGRKEPFDSEKIRNVVIMAATQAGLKTDDATVLSVRVVDLIEESTIELMEVKSSEIKEKILSFLDTASPNVAKSWRNYEATK